MNQSTDMQKPKDSIEGVIVREFSGQQSLVSETSNLQQGAKLLLKADPLTQESCSEILSDPQKLTQIFANLTMIMDFSTLNFIVKFYSVNPSQIEIENFVSYTNLNILQNNIVDMIQEILRNLRSSAPADQTLYQRNKRNQTKMISMIESELFVRCEQNHKAVIDFAIEKGWHQVSSELFKLYVKNMHVYGENLVNVDTLISAIESGNLAFINRCFRWRDTTEACQTVLEHPVVVKLVLKNLEDPEKFLFNLYVLKKASQKILVKSFDFMVSVVSTFEKITSGNYLRIIIRDSVTPIITFVICAQIMKKFSISQFPNQSKLDELANKFLEIAISFINSTHDSRTLEKLLFGAVFPTDKPLIYTIRNENYQDFFEPILSDQRICEILYKKWSCHYRNSWNILATSTSYNILIGQTGLKLKQIFQYQERTLKQVQAHQNQQSKAQFEMVQINPANQDSIVKNRLQLAQQQNNTIQNIEIKDLQEEENNADRDNSFSPVQQQFEKQTTFQSQQSLIKENQNSLTNNFDNSMNFFLKNLPITKPENFNKTNYFYQINIFQRSIKFRLLIEFMIMIIIGVLANLYLSDLSPLIENFRNMEVDQWRFMNYQKISDVLLTDSSQLIPDCKIPVPTSIGSDAPIQITYTPAIQLTRATDFNGFCINLLIQPLLVANCVNPDNYTYYLDNCVKMMDTLTKLDKYFNKVIVIMYLSALYIFNPINQIAYLLANKKKLVINMNMMVDLCISAGAIIFILLRQFKFPKTSPNAMNDGSPIDDVKQLLRLVNVSVIMVIVFFWIKSIFFMSRTKTLGVLIKTIFLMIKDLFSFIIIVVVTIYSVSSVMFLLFSSEIQQFTSLSMTLRIGFERMMGQFDFENHSLAPTLITIAFVVFTNVVLLNLLVAIMSSTYEQLQQKGNMEYALIVYNDYYSMKFQSQNSVWIALNGPLAVFSFIFGLMITLTPKKVKKFVNQFWITVVYTIILLIPSYGIYLALSLVCLPFSWLFYFYVILMQEIRKSRRKMKTFNFVLFIAKTLFWLFAGLPYLIFVSIISDSWMFFRSSFQHINSKDQFPRSTVFDLQTMRALQVLRNQFTEEAEKEIDQNQLFEAILNIVKISNQRFEEQKSGQLNPELIEDEFSTILSNFFGQLDVQNLDKEQVDQLFDGLRHFILATEYSAQYLKPARAQRRKLSRFLYSYSPFMYTQSLENLQNKN